MSGFKKTLFLFLALLLPVLVFVFLKFFGKNEFAVTPLFQDSIQHSPVCNSFKYQTPYTLPDSTLAKLGWSNSDSVMLVVFDDKIQENRHSKLSQIQRILEEFGSEKLRIRCIVEKGESNWLAPLSNLVITYELSSEEFTTTRSCIFLLSKHDNVAMIDSRKRIRGQYNLNDLEDGDRLVVHELNILFKRY